MAIGFPEKRDFPRIKIHTPLHYQIRGRPEFNDTLSRDISLGGIGCINNKFIAPQTPLNLEINLLSQPICSTARVAWAQPLPHSDRYRLGIEFMALDIKQKDYLRDFINMKVGSL